jgi:hypothetical protein
MVEMVVRVVVMMVIEMVVFGVLIVVVLTSLILVSRSILTKLGVSDAVTRVISHVIVLSPGRLLAQNLAGRKVLWKEWKQCKKKWKLCTKTTRQCERNYVQEGGLRMGVVLVCILAAVVEDRDILRAVVVLVPVSVRTLPMRTSFRRVKIRRSSSWVMMVNDYRPSPVSCTKCIRSRLLWLVLTVVGGVVSVCMRLYFVLLILFRVFRCLMMVLRMVSLTPKNI